MRSAKHLLAIFTCLLLCLPVTQAQDAQSAKTASDVTIIIQREQVRFAAQRAVEEMRLQVFDQTGDLIYDSGPVIEPEINWPLQNGNGQSLKSGLYAYTLFLKETGQDAARLRRGHFIVDRAKERDGNADKLWVTSQNDNGVGADLTLARDENSTVAGTVLNGERTIERRAENSDRATSDRKTEAKSTSQTATNNLAPNTIGQIAKFTGANNELGDSVITEANGNIGISTGSPSSKLTVQTGVGLRGLTHTDGAISVGSYVGGSGSGAAGGWLGTFSNHDLHFFTNNGQPSLSVGRDGNLGVGAASGLRSKLTVEGQDALTLRGSGPFLTLQDTSRPGANKHRIQSASGELGFFQEVTTQFGFSFQPRLMIKDNGNVHVGPGSSSIAAGRVNAVVASGNPDAGIAIAQNSGVNVLLQASGAGGYIGTTSNHPLVLRSNDLDRVVVAPNGNLGVGTTAPRHQLSLGRGPHWTSNSWGGAIELENGSAIGWKANAAGNRFGIGHTNGGLFFFRTQSDPAATNAPAIGDLSINDAGNVGIGTVNAATKLHVEGTDIVQATIKSNDERAILVLDSNPVGLAGRYVWTLESGLSGTAGVFGIYDRNAGKERLKIYPTGLVSVNSLEIRGGSDFSENFDISDTATNGATQLKPGLVVSINPAQPGKLLLSARAYDRRVAGIISGAGDIKPGVVMSQEGSVADGRHPVALSGRVYVWADTARGAIKPGDLLTTSPTPGHAMKVTNPARAQGAIIGKAMTGLKSGRGLVLVLVTLQ